MIAILKSKKEVLINPFSGESGKPVVEVVNLIKNNGGYTFNVRYFFTALTGEVDSDNNPVTKEKEIQSMTAKFSNEEADALYNALNINYPQGETFSARDTLEVAAGLRYIVAREKRWGLEISDWE